MSNKQKIRVFLDAEYPVSFRVEGLHYGQQLEVYDTYGLAHCDNWPGDDNLMPIVNTEYAVSHPHMFGQPCAQKITVIPIKRI